MRREESEGALIYRHGKDLDLCLCPLPDRHFWAGALKKDKQVHRSLVSWLLTSLVETTLVLSIGGMHWHLGASGGQERRETERGGEGKKRPGFGVGQELLWQEYLFATIKYRFTLSSIAESKESTNVKICFS